MNNAKMQAIEAARHRFEEWFMPEPNSGCWLWLKSINNQGYGNFHFPIRQTITAHRVSWILRNGPIENDLIICHKCDVCSCVNPDHMFLGDPKDNALDRKAKGRGYISEGIQLSPEQVLAIRDDTRPRRLVATDYGITTGHVSRIRRRSAWRHLSPAHRNTQ